MVLLLRDKENNMDMRIFGLVLIFAFTLSGCANLNSIHRSTDNDDSTIDFIDAKQRAVWRVKNKTEGKTIICAEPSPDVFSVFSANFGANASKGNIQAAFNTAIAEGGSTIGIRTASIQLLRDAMYRACEAYASGALTPQEYARLTKRYQKSMVTLLAIEQLTNTVYPPIISLTSTSHSEYNRQIVEATKAQIATKDKLKQLEKDLLEANKIGETRTAVAIDADKERTKKDLELWKNALKQIKDKEPSRDVIVKSTISPNTRTVMPVDIKTVTGTIERMLEEVYKTNIIELCFQTDLLKELREQNKKVIQLENEVLNAYNRIKRTASSKKAISIQGVADDNSIAFLTKDESRLLWRWIDTSGDSAEANDTATISNDLIKKAKQVLTSKKDGVVRSIVKRYNQQTEWCNSVVNKIL